MPSCAFTRCRNHSDRKNKSHGVTFHSFPVDDLVRHKWLLVVRRQRRDPDWTSNQHSRVCSAHFKLGDLYTTNKGYIRLSKTAVPFFQVSEQPALLPAPGPSHAPDPNTSDTNVSHEPQDPLSIGTIEQCRFCGDFSKQCVLVSDRPYLSTHRTTLAFNDMIVQIDFNDNTLPNTVCRNCDEQLQGMFDFVKVVKNAQQSLINIAAEETEVKVEPGEIETVVIKTECEDSQDSNDENDDHGKDNKEEDESKDGILDSITIGKTVFIKDSVAPKRKIYTLVKMPKKAKVTERKTEIEDNELIINIKEEVIEKDDTNDEGKNTGVRDTSTDDKPSESELAANALVHVVGSGGDGSWTFDFNKLHSD